MIRCLLISIPTLLLAAQSTPPATPKPAPAPKRTTTDLCELVIGGGSTVSVTMVTSGKDVYPEIAMVDQHAIRVVSGWLTISQAQELRKCLDEALKTANVK